MMHRVCTPLMLAALALTGCATDDVAATSPVSMAMPPIQVGLTLDAPTVVAPGDPITFTATGANPGERVRFVAGNMIGDGPAPLRLGEQDLGLVSGGEFFVSAVADQAGVATATFNVPGIAQVGDIVYAIAITQRGTGGADSVSSNVVRIRAGDGSARIRVVHASHNAPNVDVYANGGLILADVSYQDVSDYLSVPPDTYTIDLRGAGAPDTDPPVFSVDLTVSGDMDYTAVAAGFFGSQNVDDQFRILPLVDAWDAPANGTYRARILHASPDAPTVDIDVFNDGTSEVPALDRWLDTGMGGIALPAEAYAVGVAGGAFPFSVPALPSGLNVTLVASGILGTRANEADAFGVLAFDETGFLAFLRVDPVVYALHASPDAPTVDIQVGGGTIVDDLSFRELSGPVQVPPGSYTLDIFDETGTTFVTDYVTPDLMPGEQYLAVATGFLAGQPGFEIIPLADDTELDDANATLYALHASPNAPEVSAGAILGGAYVPLSPNFVFGESAVIGGVAPGTYDLAVADSLGSPLFTFSGIGLDAGNRLFTVANGDVDLGDFALTIVDPSTNPWSSFTLTPDP